MAKHSINLLQAGLLPTKALWSLNRVVAVWGITLVVMLGIIFIVQLQVNNVKAEFESVNSINTAKTTELKSLESAISNNRQDSKLLAQLNTIKLVIANKEHLHLSLIHNRSRHRTR